MNPREKRLLVIVGVAVALFAAKGVRTSYREKLASLDRDIEKKQAELDDARNEISDAARAAAEWRRIGSQTLSLDPNEAITLLRDELNRLARETGLPNADVNVGAPAKWRRQGLQVLSAGIDAEGPVESVVAFLVKVHRQPYLVRCQSLTLTPVMERQRRTRGAPAKSPEGTGRMEMSARLETLITCRTPMVPASQLRPAQLDPENRRDVDRTMFVSAAQYVKKDGGITRGLFEPAKPPIPPPAKVAGPTPAHNGSIPVSANQALRWQPAAHATSYKIHFGTASPPPLKHTAPTPTWSAGKVEDDKSYFWRIDSVNDTGTTEGDIWKFTVKADAQPVTPVAPPAPPEDSTFTLVRILSSPWGQQVVLQDPKKAPKPNQPDESDVRIRVGDPMYGGTLVFVHPRGAVTEKSGVWIYHAMGKQLQEGLPIDEKEQPQIYDELKKLQERAAGISRRPG